MCEGGREVARGGDGARLLVELGHTRNDGQLGYQLDCNPDDPVEVFVVNYHTGGSLLGESRQKGLERGVRGEECDAFSCVPPSHYRTPR